MALKKKHKSYEVMRQRYGYTFVAHWILGLLLFSIVPIIESLIYSFESIKITDHGFETKFVGFKNFKYLLVSDPNYVDNLADSVMSIIYSLPMIVALSLILAVLLNHRYRGRAVFRLIFFLPVIFSSSIVVKLLSDPSINAPIFNMTAEGEGVFDYYAILGQLSIPAQIRDILVFFISNSINLTWSCGIQTILFLAGLQGISDSLYEVSKIEGATKWQEFWMITVPMLRSILSLVVIYTMIALFTSANNKIMMDAVQLTKETNYETVSAMLWFYFVIVIAVIGIVMLFYNKRFVKKWE